MVRVMRKIKSLPMLSALSFFLTCSMMLIFCQPGSCDIVHCAEAYRKARTASDRLKVCVGAIDRGDIAEGMKASDLEQILHCEIKPPAKEGAMNCEVIRFGDHTSQWYMFIFLDHDAKVRGYYVTNVDAKNGFIGNESKEDQDKAAAVFKRSRTERQKLDRCIRIINQKLVWWNMPETNLESLFGKATEHGEHKDGSHYESIPFSHGVSAWRFSYQAKNGQVEFYYLSNMNPEEPMEEYWKAFK